MERQSRISDSLGDGSRSGSILLRTNELVRPSERYKEKPVRTKIIESVQSSLLNGLPPIDFTQDVADQYIQLDSTKDVLAQAQDMAHKVDRGEIKNNLRGKVFEDLAYNAIAQREMGGVVLSPDETVDLYAKLFPHETMSHWPFDMRSFKFSLDGFVLSSDPGDPKVVGLVEYKSNLESTSFMNIRHKHFGVENLAQTFPKWFSKSTPLHLVIPQDDRPPDRIRNWLPNSNIVRVPFTKSTLDSVVQRIMKQV